MIEKQLRENYFSSYLNDNILNGQIPACSSGLTARSGGMADDGPLTLLWFIVSLVLWSL